MYEGYDKCMSCKTELFRSNFGGGHKYGNDTDPDPKKRWMIIEAVCKKCQPLWEGRRSDRIRR